MQKPSFYLLLPEKKENFSQKFDLCLLFLYHRENLGGVCLLFHEKRGVENVKDVIISIKGLQGPQMTSEDGIELITSGAYWTEGPETVFSYMESEVTGMEGTRTTFRVSPRKVTLIREGTLNAQMVFEQGKKHLFLYETPYGAMSMGVDTRRLTTGLGASGGDMEIDYTIDVDSVVVSENSFVIHVRESGKGLGA